MTECLQQNWGLIITLATPILVLIIDKYVAMSKSKHDDMLWSIIKGAIKPLRGKKGKG